jgi:hypothetical protein
MSGGIMKKLILSLIVVLVSSHAFAASNPATVFISLYAIAVSQSTDCSNPIVVVDYGDTPKEFNFASSPRLGGGFVPDGTYPCVMLKMKDVIRFRPATTDQACIAGTEYPIDVCRSGTHTPLAVSTATFGSGTCSGTNDAPVDDKVTLFISTISTYTGQGGGSCFTRPTDSPSTQGFTLNGPFVVSGSKSGTFVVNFNGKVDGSQNGATTCDLLPPVFGFR